MDIKSILNTNERTRSTDSSPTIRSDSRSPSETSQQSRQRRESRPKYFAEEDAYIWFCRDDRSLTWEQVKTEFNRKFPRRKREGLQGIQGRYYRVLKAAGAKKVRDRERGGSRRPYGLRQNTAGLHYDWMSDDN
ncbi:MAG: hypothetical protein M1829_001887 [Trizodia sp. TS-e1964]|nr:MAG: hypothetical protein M1829_001887 [Trizodia sp. TS-e1964]